MPTVIPSQTGRQALTDVVHLLAPGVEKEINRTFTLKTPLTKILRRRGRVKRTGNYQTRFNFEIGPSWNAGHRDVGQNLPTEEPELASSATERIDQRRIQADVYLQLQYSGITIDGPTIDLARSGSSLSDPLKRDITDAMEMLAFTAEIAVAGRGTGELFVVDSVSGSTLVVRNASGTVANAGNMGGSFLRGGAVGMPLTFHDLSASTPRTNNGAGFLVRDWNPTTRTLTLDRSVAAASVAAGDVAILGDSNANERDAVPIGIDGQIDDGRRRRFLYGLNRASERYLNCFRIDAQTAGGALGEFNFATFMRAVMAANFENDGRALLCLHHHYLSMEQIYGSLINPLGTTRNLAGLVTERRFGAKGQLASGASGVVMPVPGFGECVFLGTYNIRPNTSYLIDPSTIVFCDHSAGIKFLPGYGYDRGAFVRQTGLDRWDAVLRRMWTKYCTAPNKNARIDNLLQQTPDF